MRPKHFFRPAGLVLAAVMLAQCAGEIPPGGGPPDTTPPEVTTTIPEANATRVAQNAVELEFSEYVDRRSVEESIFISPYVGQLEFDWSGTGVEIQFGDTLRPNTTYVVNIGTDVVDLRARNRMAKGFTLAFTTGDSIDQGFIDGKVFDAKPEGVMIFAYLLHDSISDTVNPTVSRPDYIMQTGKDGSFSLAHLALGTYRVFAVRDEYRNFLYDREIDQYGVANSDILLDDMHQRVDGVFFRMTAEDTTQPFISSAQSLNDQLIRVRFSEAIDSTSFDSVRFELSDTLGASKLEPIISYFDLTNPSVAYLLPTTRLSPGNYYKVIANGVRDRAGNVPNEAGSVFIFPVEDLPDTTLPAIQFLNTANGSSGFPPADPIRVHFTKPVQQSPLGQGIQVLDTLKQVVPASLSWVSPADATLKPVTTLAEATDYLIQVILDSLRDMDGNRHTDSVLTVRFQTLDPRNTGTMEGNVVDLSLTAGGGAVCVTATRVDVNPPQARTISLDQPANFTLDLLPEGKYLLGAFRDADSSGSYSFGLPFPYVPSERFAIYPDTLKVRARWGVEGVILSFK